MTECNQEHFEFVGHYSKQVVVEFDGEQTSSDGGALLLREVDRRLGLSDRLGGLLRRPMGSAAGGAQRGGDAAATAVFTGIRL